MTTHEKGASSTQKLEFPTANRPQALHQLELLGYQPEDKIYLQFFYPADDPRKNSDKGRKADSLNWQEIETHFPHFMINRSDAAGKNWVSAQNLSRLWEFGIQLNRGQFNQCNRGSI